MVEKDKNILEDEFISDPEDINLDKLNDETLEFEDEDDEIDDFNLETLIVEGKDAIIERAIKYFNLKKNKVRKMRIYVKPIPYTDMRTIEDAIKKDKKNKKDLIISACQRAWVKDLDGTPMTKAEIISSSEGTPKAVWEEIKIVSNHLQDRLEDKMIDKLADF